jgi:4-hydroxy-4-methyl-2-oxoglutarate aldolase
VWRGGRVLGSAYTVKLSPGDNLGALIACTDGQPGDVLVVQAGEGEPTAIAGALAVRAARERKIAGMVIDGAVRDTRDLEAMGYPVWSRYVCPRQSSKDKPAELGVPVVCGGVRVSPGDLVVADDDGVVFASPAAVTAALDALDKVLANEKRWEDPAALLQAFAMIVSKTPIERS